MARFRRKAPEFDAVQIAASMAIPDGHLSLPRGIARDAGRLVVADSHGGFWYPQVGDWVVYETDDEGRETGRCVVMPDERIRKIAVRIDGPPLGRHRPTAG